MSDIVRIPTSAEKSKAIVKDGIVSAEAAMETLGAIVTEVLSRDIETARAHAGIRGIRAMGALIDVFRRNADLPGTLVTNNHPREIIGQRAQRKLPKKSDEEK